MSSGVWGQKPLDAVRAPPPVVVVVPPTSTTNANLPNTSSSRNTSKPTTTGRHNNTTRHSKGNQQQQQQSQQQSRHHGQQQHSQSSGRGRGNGGGGRGGTTGGRGNTTGVVKGRGPNTQNQHSKNHHHHKSNHPSGKEHQHHHHHHPTATITLHVELLIPGDGTNDQQKSVCRYTAHDLLQWRLQYLQPPSSTMTFSPPEPCVWTDETMRIEDIQNRCQLPSQLGDVSLTRPRPPPPPPLEDCAPLQVNEETRWKARIFTATDGDNTTNDTSDNIPSNEDILKTALLILNKLSLTKFQKLSKEFSMSGIDRNGDTLKGAVHMIVDKAQSEPHFSSMYAQLCLFLHNTNVGGPKVFKKELLTRCQQEFHETIVLKIAKATAGIEDIEERTYQEVNIKKKYLGHMRFIGELYKEELIRLDIMISCLQKLLDGTYEDDKVECFTKLMSTIGFKLEMNANKLYLNKKPSSQEQLNACWKKVDEIISDGASPRIKFMLLDLKEMKEKGWITRRKEDKIMTIEEIHQEVANEEAEAARRVSRLRRASSSDLKGLSADGFRKVSFLTSRSTSSGALMTQPRTMPATIPPPGSVRRVQSMSVVAVSKSSSTTLISSKLETKTNQPSDTTTSKKNLSIRDLEVKAPKLLKEYSISGDSEDTLVSIKELLDSTTEGGDMDTKTAKLVEAFVLWVLEQKQDDVDKMICLIQIAYQRGILTTTSLLQGLRDPLEFLSDIEIDAPLARTFLQTIVQAFAELTNDDKSFEDAKQLVGNIIPTKKE